MSEQEITLELEEVYTDYENGEILFAFICPENPEYLSFCTVYFDNDQE